MFAVLIPLLRVPVRLVGGIVVAAPPDPTRGEQEVLSHVPSHYENPHPMADLGEHTHWYEWDGWRWVWGRYRSSNRIGAVFYERIVWPVVIFEQVLVLLLAGAAWTWAVRRDRRRGTTSG